MENTGATLTGKASVDKPWLQFYPEALRNVEVPTITVETFLRAKNPDENKILRKQNYMERILGRS